MSTKFECHWGDCNHPEFEDLERYKEHIERHIESLQPMRVSEIPEYRRAGGFGPASSAPRSKFDYIFNTQDSFLKAGSSTDANKPKGKAFSALGLAAQATPPISPLIASPSMSTKIRDIHSPAQGKLKPRWDPPSPMHGLASAANDDAFATPSETAFSSAAGRVPSARDEDVPVDVDVTKTPATARSESPDTDGPAENPRKRKQSVMFTEPTTPANKRKKKNPKTPFPDPDLDSSEDERPSDDEVEQPQPNEEDPYAIFTQAPISSWDEFETPSLDDEVGASFLQKLDGTGEASIEEVGEEHEVASQLGEGGLRVEDVTTPSPKHA